jgi:hypothetical protein
VGSVWAGRGAEACSAQEAESLTGPARYTSCRHTWVGMRARRWAEACSVQEAESLTGPARYTSCRHTRVGTRACRCDGAHLRNVHSTVAPSSLDDRREIDACSCPWSQNHEQVHVHCGANAIAVRQRAARHGYGMDTQATHGGVVGTAHSACLPPPTISPKPSSDRTAPFAP